MMEYYTICGQTGALIRHECESLPAGRWVTREGKWIRLSEHGRGPVHFSRDDLGTKGVLNPVNGKMYDSRSQYYRAVKDSGHIILGDDAPTTGRKETYGDFDCKKELSQAIDQVLSKQPGKKRK